MIKLLFGIIFVLIFIIALLYARCIDNMKEKYPDYKGEDFLNTEDNKHKN